MKTVLLISVLSLFTLTLSSPLTDEDSLTDAESLTLTSLTHVLSLSDRPICRARPVYRTVACLCFLAFEKGVITSDVRASCKALFGRAARNLSSRCSSFVRGGKLRPFRAIGAAKKIQTCFTDAEEIVLPPGAGMPGGRGGVPIKEIFDRLAEVRTVLDDTLGVLDVMLVLPSTPARVVVVGHAQKAMRLAAYNHVEQAL